MSSIFSDGRLAKFFATLFGVGYIPKAPGTAGSLVALIVYLLLPGSIFISVFPGLAALIIITLMAVKVSGAAERVMDHDDSRIVLDEFVGFFFAVLFLPKILVLAVIAFILFRVLDIFKPVPVNLVQKLTGGWGVVADDVLAGIITNLLLQITIRIFPEMIK